MTLLYTHESCIAHDMGQGHPEQPDRLRFILKGLAEEEFSSLDRRDAPLATLVQVGLVHPKEHIEKIMSAVPDAGLASIDGDTSLCAHSGEAALRAVGAITAAIDEICAPEASEKNAFCATRPPGHHAEPDRAMGFCIFNSVAIGAAYVRDTYDISKCAIVDFDVHHGNGTEAYVREQKDFLYLSTHQSPLYPGTGAAQDHGVYNNIVNAPLPAFASSEDFHEEFRSKIIPALESYKPEFIFISAGFDAHKDDPLAQMSLVEEDFAWATDRLLEVANRYSHGRVVSTLEGGYDLDALRRSTCAHVRQLMKNDI